VELRDLPSVDELAADERLATAAPRPLLVAAVRSALERAREEIRAGADPGDLVDRVESELAAARGARLRRVINATGVIATPSSESPRLRPATRTSNTTSTTAPAVLARITSHRSCDG